MKKAIQVTEEQKKQVLYFEALQMVWEKFLEEEKQRNSYTELRLVNGIEAARTLYK